MRVGYGFGRTERDFGRAKVDRVYLDTAFSERTERADMLRLGLRRGDVLVLLRPGDLGHGKDLINVRQMLADMGVKIEIGQGLEDKRPPGRPRAFEPSPEQDERIKGMWYAQGIYLTRGVEQRASEIMGHPVTRNQLDHRYGPRDGSMPEGRKRK